MKLRELALWALFAGITVTGACAGIRDMVAREGRKMLDEIVIPKVVSVIESKAATFVSKEDLAKWRAAADTDKSGDVSGAEWTKWLGENWREVILAVGGGWLVKRNVASAKMKQELRKDVDTLKNGNGPSAG